jgi:hypothetical protein
MRRDAEGFELRIGTTIHGAHYTFSIAATAAKHHVDNRPDATAKDHYLIITPRLGTLLVPFACRRL